MTTMPAEESPAAVASKTQASANELDDPRERMRAKAKEDQQNPWLNVAGYLAGKAKEQIFGAGNT